MNSILVLIGLLTVSLAGAIDYVRLPVNYVTAENAIASAVQKQYFIANLCGGEPYDGEEAYFNFNQPGQRWGVETGYYLKGEAWDSNNKLVGTNKKGDDYTQEFHFPYSSDMKDIKLHVTDGEGTGQWAYTITLKFKPKPSDNETKFHPRARKPFRHVVSKEEMMHVAQLEEYHEIEYVQLMQVFTLEGNGSAITFELSHFKMEYCFLPSSHPYNITVSTISLDQISAMGTYVCPKQHQPCRLTTPFRDPSGCAANFVTAVIEPVKDYGHVEVIVQGEGRYQGKNTFRIASSGYTGH